MMKGRDRNQPCFCGSGKKWKKCHPNHDADSLARQERLSAKEEADRNDKTLQWIKQQAREFKMNQEKLENPQEVAQIPTKEEQV